MTNFRSVFVLFVILLSTACQQSKSPTGIIGGNEVCYDWSFNASTNNIKLNTPFDIKKNILRLGFDNPILVKIPKNRLKESTHPFGDLSDNEVFDKQITVNGEIFDGIIIGYHIKEQKEILRLILRDGWRYGVHKVSTNEGNHEQKDFTNTPANIMRFREEVARKPLIYLYPESEQSIHVKLDFEGEITHTYPKYNIEKGWNVVAQPNGILTNLENGKSYYGLYWEGKYHSTEQIQEGFIVKGEDVIPFLDKKLAELGLNRREANEFIIYWLPLLESNAYNLIHFAQESYQELAQLHISPKPETLIRVFMMYQPLENPIDIAPQNIQTPDRKGFVVVEWGGAQVGSKTWY